MNQSLKKFLFFLTAANLCFLRQWSLLFARPSEWNFESASAFPASFVALPAAVLLLAAALWWVWHLGTIYLPKYLFAIELAGGMALTFLIFNALRGTLSGSGFHFAGYLHGGSFRHLIILSTVFAAAVMAVVLKRVTVLRKGIFVLFVLSAPFFFLNCLLAITSFGKASARLRPAIPSVAGAVPQSGRVIWMIFDMWDKRLTFDQRRPDLDLPNIDSLKQTAFSASQALPPASWTQLSIASSLIGKSVQRLEVSGETRQVQIQLCGEERTRAWEDTSQYFPKMAALGYENHLVGWHLPYCQLFPGSLASCARFPVHNVAKRPYRASFSQSVVNYFSELSLMRFSFPSTHYQHASEMIADSARLVADPKATSVFVHWPFPHDPFMYDATTREFGSTSGRPLTYWDNLALVDRLIGETRAALERSGQWETTTLLITGDHSTQRTKVLPSGKTLLVSSTQSRVELPESAVIDRRIPFFIKLPHQDKGLVYERPLNSIISAAMLMDIANGQIVDSAGLAAWVDKRQPEIEAANTCLLSYHSELLNLP